MATSKGTENQLFLENGHGLDRSETAFWHESAPREVRRALGLGELAAGWAAWRKYLARRSRPVDPARLLPSGGSAMRWALPEGPDAGRPSAGLRQIEGLLTGRPRAESPQRQLRRWLDQWAGGPPETEYALQAVAWCRALPRLAADVSPPSWWALLRHLLAAAVDAAVISLDERPLVHQLLCGELPLTLAYLLPEIVPCRRLAPAGRRALSLGLDELLDGKGLPHAKHLALLRPLLACWTRCRAFSDGLKRGCWTAAAQSQYRWLVRHALRLARRDGTHVFCSSSAEGWNPELFAAALHLGGNAADRRIAARVLPPQPTSSVSKNDAGKANLPNPAIHSPWAAAAVLRPAWSRRGERLTVLYPQQSVRLELAHGKDVLFSGLWALDVRFHGQPAALKSEWEEVCWVSDEDLDYLELEIALGAGLRVQRHLLLARQDHFLLLADAILGDRPGVIDYRGTLPLCAGVAFRGAAETREGLLVGRKRRGLVLPLALPEWRGDVRVGELAQTAAGLELSQAAEGCRLFAPLFFDLDRRRTASPLTWRQLTVAESRTVQPQEVAVGYRVAIGKRQWLIYRSLAPKANRTLLGHNLSTDLLVARFDRSGEVEPLLEVE